MLIRNKRHVLRKPEGDDGGGAGTAPAPGPAAPATPATPAASTAPAAPAPSPAAPAAPAPGPAAPAPAPADVKATWPDDWRQQIAGGDEKVQKQLERYASPKDVWNKARALEQRLSSGDLKPTLAKDATPEQVKEYRAALGIPETPDKYDFGKVKVDDSDKPVMDAMVKAMHGVNATPEQVQMLASTWNHIKRTSLDAQVERDNKVKTASEDALRAEWGTEFRRNLNLVYGLFDAVSAPELKDKLLQARLPDGTPFASSAEVMKMLVSLALIQNPTGTVVPGGPGEKGEGLRGELEKLEKIPASRKTAEQDSRQRDLINAAIKAGWMDSAGKWKAA